MSQLRAPRVQPKIASAIAFVSLAHSGQKRPDCEALIGELLDVEISCETYSRSPLLFECIHTALPLKEKGAYTHVKSPWGYGSFDENTSRHGVS